MSTSPLTRRFWPRLAGLLLVTQLAIASTPDPRATALIQDLGLQASATASRDLPGWKVPERVVVALANAEQIAALQAVVPEVKLVAAASGDALNAQLADAQVYIGPCNPATLEAAKSLHWMQAMSVGVERCVGVPGLAERQLVLTNMQRTSGLPEERRHG